MKILIALCLLIVSTLPMAAQSNDSPGERKNNLKINMAEFGQSFTNSPVLFNTFIRVYTLEYERLLQKRHSFTFSPTYGFVDYSEHNTAALKISSNFFSLGLGYKGYFLLFNNKRAFNGFYGGAEFFGGGALYRRISNGTTVYKNTTTLIGAAPKLGMQITFLKRLSLDIETSYRVENTSTTNRTSTLSYLNHTVRLGFTF